MCFAPLVSISYKCLNIANLCLFNLQKLKLNTGQSGHILFKIESKNIQWLKNIFVSELTLIPSEPLLFIMT